MNKNLSIKYGLLAGVGAVAYFLLFYFINRPLVIHPAVWWTSMIIYLVAMFKAVKAQEDRSFRIALREAFVVFILANAVFYLFYYFLFGVFDPGLVDLQEEMLAVRPQLPNKPVDITITPYNIFFNYCYSLIGGFVISLLPAGLAKRL